MIYDLGIQMIAESLLMQSFLITRKVTQKKSLRIKIHFINNKIWNI